MKTAFLALLLATSALAQQATFVQPSLEEVTAALGVKPYCWDITSAEPVYARLVARTSRGVQIVALTHATTFVRVRIFTFASASSESQLQRVTYSLEGAKGERSQRVDTSLASCDIKHFSSTTEPNVSMTLGGEDPSGKAVTLSITLEMRKDPFPAQAP